jgi:hypothetical protein
MKDQLAPAAYIAASFYSSSWRNGANITRKGSAKSGQRLIQRRPPRLMPMHAPIM